MPSRRDLATVSGLILSLSIVAGLGLYLNGCAAGPVSTIGRPPSSPPPNLVSDPAPPPAQPQLSQPEVAAKMQVPAPPIPDLAEARQLARSSFMLLAGAIKTRDFSTLYAAMAPTFRSGVSLQRMVDGFRPFTDNGVDLTRVNANLLVVTPAPAISDRGVLIIRGFEPTPVQTWYFEFGFLPVGPGWALTSLSLSSTEE